MGFVGWTVAYIAKTLAGSGVVNPALVSSEAHRLQQVGDSIYVTVQGFQGLRKREPNGTLSRQVKDFVGTHPGNGLDHTGQVVR